MKKKIVAFITAILAIVMGASVFGGCNLVTLDEERDMNQIVATVQIDNNAKVDNIYKRELVFAYINNAYIYTQYYGYTQAQTVEALLGALINNRILVQSAMKYYTEPNATCTYNVADYLTQAEKDQALSDTYSEIESLLKSYIDADKVEANKDTLTEDVRTVPTNAANAEAEKVTYTSVDVTSTIERRNAYDRLIRFLKDNGLLGENYKGKIEETAYFDEILEGKYEQTLIENFEKDKNAEYRSAFTYADIQKAYADAYAKQTEFSSKDFADALSNAKAASPVFYGAYGNYGYVYNLLLGVNDLQSAEIKAIDVAKSDVDKKTERKAILDATTVKDLRSTWILSGYDFDGEKFTGDYTFYEDGDLAYFQGEVSKVKDADEAAGTSAEYKIESVKTFGLDEFIKKFVDGYVYGSAEALAADAGDTDISIYKKVTISDAVVVANYEDKINELMFAFSTDPGSLNSYKGYVISPNNTEGWVADFAAAGKTLLSMGGKSYIIVASDYGYHILFFSQKFELGDGKATLTEYLGYDTDIEAKSAYDALIAGWDGDDIDKDSFLYLFTDATISAKVSAIYDNYREGIVNTYKDDADRVKVYSDRYSDLLG